MSTTQEFDGAKVALFLGHRLLIIRRDDRPDIVDAGLWDFPGGGREGEETPFQTVARETREEVGLVLTPACVLWQRRFAAPQGSDRWFFVARLPARMQADVVFGDEGQGWRMADVPEVLALPDVAGALQQRLALWLAGEAACDAVPAGLSV
ncbi:MAG: NUDIX hydrolase [Alphaproteobacteria bacterium]|nr:NUDIX hydrolase [Alphaproteobacteria bacterium]